MFHNIVQENFAQFKNVLSFLTYRKIVLFQLKILLTPNIPDQFQFFFLNGDRV